VGGLEPRPRLGCATETKPAPENLGPRELFESVCLLATRCRRLAGPGPNRDFAHEGWFERYDKRLQEATGHRLEPLPAHACPPRRPTQLWIAIIAEDGPSNHAVVARQAFVVHDPAGDYMGILPRDRLAGGLLVVPTRRVIPVFSPHRSGYSVVAA